MSKATELARKYRLTTFVQGDDGFGGEDEPQAEVVAAIDEALEWAALEADREEGLYDIAGRGAQASRCIANRIRAGKTQ